jgi:hypothetical protein
LSATASVETVRISYSVRCDTGVGTVYRDLCRCRTALRGNGTTASTAAAIFASLKDGDGSGRDGEKR